MGSERNHQVLVWGTAACTKQSKGPCLPTLRNWKSFGILRDPTNRRIQAPATLAQKAPKLPEFTTYISAASQAPHKDRLRCPAERLGDLASPRAPTRGPRRGVKVFLPYTLRHWAPRVALFFFLPLFSSFYFFKCCGLRGQTADRSSKLNSKYVNLSGGSLF